MTSRVDECGLWIQSEDGSAPPQPWHGKNKKGIEGSGRFAFALKAYGLLCQKFLPVPPAHQQRGFESQLVQPNMPSSRTSKCSL